MLKNQIFPWSKNLAPVFMAAGLGAMSLTGCSAVQMRSPLPSLTTEKSLDPRDCHENKGIQFDGGWFIPVDFKAASTVKFNEVCDRANVAKILLTSTSKQDLAIALDIYDFRLDKAQQKRLDIFLAQNETDIKAVRKRLPALVSQRYDAEKECRVSTMTLASGGQPPVQVIQCNPEAVAAGINAAPKP